jgi:hypothetical protein
LVQGGEVFQDLVWLGALIQVLGDLVILGWHRWTCDIAERVFDHCG